MTASPQPEPSDQTQPEGAKPQGVPSHTHEREAFCRELAIKLEFAVSEFLQRHHAWVPPVVMESDAVRKAHAHAKEQCQIISDEVRKGAVFDLAVAKHAPLDWAQDLLAALGQAAEAFCHRAREDALGPEAYRFIAKNAKRIGSRLEVTLITLHRSVRDALQVAITEHTERGAIDQLLQGCTSPNQYYPVIARSLLSRFNGPATVLIYTQEQLPRYLLSEDTYRQWIRRSHYFIERTASDDVVQFIDSALALLPAQDSPQQFQSIAELAKEVPGITVPKAPKGLTVALFPIELEARKVGCVVVLKSEPKVMNGELVRSIKAVVSDLEHHMARLVRSSQLSTDNWVE